jgi:glycosidase
MSSTTATEKSHPWWKDVICYQVWPLSFKDSTGDGRGDIRGVISKLEYLKDLGIDCIWLCPTYESPMIDYGYDISDYQRIQSQFGTMQDMEDLIKKVHELGMKILLDLVVTHTSNQHAWFQESRSSKDNPKNDWYIWENPRPGHEVFNTRIQEPQLVEQPTNWRSAFGGSAWAYAPERDQYYLHLFYPHQPDLNWELKHVREKIYEAAIGFWLEKGIDGFRIDTANRISKQTPWVDANTTNEAPYQPASRYYINGPRSHEFLKEMRAYMDNHPAVRARNTDLMLVGELPLTPYNDVKNYTLPASKELNMVFDFDMIKLGGHDGSSPVQYSDLCLRITFPM